MPDFDGPMVHVDLPRGNAIDIRLRKKITKDEFAKVLQIFELSEIAFVEETESQPATPATPD